jgi:hypothetical protein
MEDVIRGWIRQSRVAQLVRARVCKADGAEPELAVACKPLHARSIDEFAHEGTEAAGLRAIARAVVLEMAAT